MKLKELFSFAYIFLQYLSTSYEAHTWKHSLKTCRAHPYFYFRRRVAAPVADRLTETQATVHRCQAWYHATITRDKANKILTHHISTDGVFLVRESSVAGGFVISMTAANKTIHSQVLPVSIWWAGRSEEIGYKSFVHPTKCNKAKVYTVSQKYYTLSWALAKQCV